MRLEFRIVKSHTGKYCVQRRHWFGWQTQSGYHRGAPGDYAYQFCSAANPYALINHTIPELEKEFYDPSLPKSRVQEMFRLRPSKLRKIVGIVDLEKATKMFRDHQATKPDVTDFMPPREIPFLQRSERGSD